MYSAVLEGKWESGSWDVWVGDAVVDKEPVTNKRVEREKKILLLEEVKEMIPFCLWWEGSCA